MMTRRTSGGGETSFSRRRGTSFPQAEGKVGKTQHVSFVGHMGQQIPDRNAGQVFAGPQIIHLEGGDRQVPLIDGLG